ncbi:MAG: HEAT repeat domain-containing protein, partial [Gemmataceae bacterium]
GALDDKALVVRVCIVRSMIQLGPPTTIEGISAMRKSLLSRLPKGGRTEPDPALQLWLQACLIRLDAVTTSIRKEDLGPDAESIIKAAKGRIDKGMALLAEKMSDEKLRITAAECLANLAPGSKSQLPKLLEGLQDDKQENYGYMSSCLFAIARIGPDVRAQAEPVVTKLVNHSNPDVKFHAQYALDRLQGKK